MKSLSVKRISLIVLCGILLFGALIFAGCDSSSDKSYEEQGYTAVYSVEYIHKTGANSEYLRTLYSTYSYSCETQTITEDEYNASTLETCNLSFSGIISSDNTINVSYEIGESYKYSDGLNFHIYTITGFDKEYLYVRILDNNKFELIDTDSNHFIINTPYYYIEYFI